MLEDEPVGFPVLHVIANDEDSHLNGEIVYAIAAGNAGNHFSIDPESGLITLAKVSLRKMNFSFCEACPYFCFQFQTTSVRKTRIVLANSLVPSFARAISLRTGR